MALALLGCYIWVGDITSEFTNTFNLSSISYICHPQHLDSFVSTKTMGFFDGGGILSSLSKKINDNFSIIFSFLLSLFSILSWGFFYYKCKKKRTLKNLIFTLFLMSSFILFGYFLSFLNIFFFRIFLIIFFFSGACLPFFILAQSSP